jgi:hypothetical protein
MDDEIIGMKEPHLIYRLFKTHYCNFEISNSSLSVDFNFFKELVELINVEFMISNIR